MQISAPTYEMVRSNTSRDVQKKAGPQAGRGKIVEHIKKWHVYDRHICTTKRRALNTVRILYQEGRDGRY